MRLLQSTSSPHHETACVGSGVSFPASLSVNSNHLLSCFIPVQEELSGPLTTATPSHDDTSLDHRPNILLAAQAVFQSGTLWLSSQACGPLKKDYSLIKQRGTQPQSSLAPSHRAPPAHYNSRRGWERGGLKQTGRNQVWQRWDPDSAGSHDRFPLLPLMLSATS